MEQVPDVHRFGRIPVAFRPTIPRADRAWPRLGPFRVDESTVATTPREVAPMRSTLRPLRSHAALLCGLLAMFAAVSAHAQRGDVGVTAHYPFEGNLDEAAGITTKPVVRGTLAYATGALGKAVVFSGDDEIDFGGIPASTFAGDFTIAWFMNLEGSDPTRLFGKEGSCNARSNFFTTSVQSGSPTKILFTLANPTAGATAVGGVTRRTWVHVAVVRSGSQAIVYVDGVAGTPQSLPALDLGSITAPFGLGNSPCIDVGLSPPRHPEGRFDELRIYPSAQSAEVIKELAQRPSFTASPGEATEGGKVTVRASHLVVDRTYELRLVGKSILGTTVVSLFKGKATSTTMNWTVTVPAVASGSYTLELVSTLLRGTENIERTQKLAVAKPLTISAGTKLQAGKPATFTIGNLPRGGSTRLLYAGRVLAGPVASTSTSHLFEVTLPRDIPASLPAEVTVRAEVLSGRLVSHLGTAKLAVAAPFTGPFATSQSLTVDRSNPMPDDTVSLSGRLTLADGATAGSTAVSAFWVGDDGNVTPLPTSALALAQDGSLRLDTRPPSVGSMTAVLPKSGGRLRLTMKRVNEIGRVEWVTEEGPRLEPIRDVDADTDITVHVRQQADGSPVALPGAYVVLSSSAPLGYQFDLPAGSGGTGEQVGGGSIYQQRPPRLGMSAGKSLGAGFGPAVNQLNNGLADLPPPPPPACGEDLYRRYTDNQGRAEFPVLGNPEQPAPQWQAVQSMQVQAADCSGVLCKTASVLQIYEFELAVYTLHLGYGYRSPTTNAEIPTRFRIRYNRSTETFTIRNLRTQQESVQQVSANLFVDVPPVEPGNFVSFDDPLMFHQIGNVPINLVGKQTGGFGRWIDFGGTGVSEFVNPSPDKVIQFGHRPDANGSIARARLFLKGINGNHSVIGEFVQTSFVDGCNLQDDPTGNRPENWRLMIPAVFAESWRFPQGVFFPIGGEKKACGYIQAENGRGGVGRKDLCFYWQAPPAFMTSESGIKVNDSDMHDVQVEISGRSVGGSATTVPKRNAAFLGEPIEKPGQIDNSTDARQGAYASVGANGPVGGSRQVAGNNPKQFSEGAAGDKQLMGVGAANTVIKIGDDEYKTVLDTTIPLFQWYWGVPELLSAEVYARLRLLASYYFGGTLTVTNGNEKLEVLTNVLFAAMISIGVDIDVLFGAIVDAGASLSGLIVSEMPVKVVNGQSLDISPCFSFTLRFDFYVDPCVLCPTPKITGGDEILNARAPENCVLHSQSKQGDVHARHPEIAAMSKVDSKEIRFGFTEARNLRRHPALAFDAQGNGQFAMLDASRQLVVSQMTSDGLSPSVLISNAPGVRDPQIAYYDVDRAVAVWSENALPEGQFVSTASTYQLLARNQRIAWAQWDGESWSDKQFLTEPGLGEGQITLTACPVGTSGCPQGGEVLAVWQRDANADARDPKYRLWFSQFRPASGFGPVASLDPTPTAGVQDITPSATYAAGRPVVVWTRQFGGSLSSFSQRNLAYRVLPDGAPIAVAGAPGALAPAVSSAGGSAIRVAWLTADAQLTSHPNSAAAGAVGTQNKLHVAAASCTATNCSFPGFVVPPARDQHGRRIYGERPRLVRGETDVLVVMRAFRFENEQDSGVQTGDPIGTVINSADVVMFAPNYGTGVGRVTPLSADGASHMSVFASFNPVSRSIISGSSTYIPQFTAPLRAALKATGMTGHVGYGKSVANAGPIALLATVAAPDLAVELIDAGTTLAPGTAQLTSVVLGNRGTGYLPARDGAAALQLRWNSPGGPLLASLPVPAIDSGGETALDLAWTAPADAHADEAHVLHAVLVMPEDLAEITDDNNQGKLELPGLPVPANIAYGSQPGIPQVQLGWDPIADPRIAGFRVYRQETDGSWVPMGATPTHGFLDLSASFMAPRTYAVASYSSRGIESALSEPVTAMPVTFVLPTPPFRDGFEALE
jgi:hypothetical protein